jgi:hypothetical protein
MNKSDAQTVAMDMELSEGVFRIGSRYHVRTPSYQYIGRLLAVTPTVFVFAESATVYETGPYPEFYRSSGTKGRDVQPHVGALELIVDRAGTVLHRMVDP